MTDRIPVRTVAHRKETNYRGKNRKGLEETLTVDSFLSKSSPHRQGSGQGIFTGVALVAEELRWAKPPRNEG